VDPPIFVFEGGLRCVLRSVEEAQARLEWPEVEDGVYEAFDSRGRRLALGVVETRRRRRGWPVVERSVSVEDAEQDASHQTELRALLVEYLRSFELDAVYLSSAALADLARLAAERHGL
jgi:hypothetical protein